MNPDILCPDSIKGKILDVVDNQDVSENSANDKNESGHLSGHYCPDRSKTSVVNGQSGHKEGNITNDEGIQKSVSKLKN